MNEPQAILVATDFSPGSRAALVQASRLCSATGASLHVLHVVPGETVTELHQLSPGNVAEIESHVLGLSDRQLADELGEAGVTATTAHSKLGSPISGVLEAIERLSADLLVIGATGAGGHRFGTIAGRCMRKSPISVLMVPPDQPGAYERIVVGLDFSDRSVSVLEHAVRIARLDSAAVYAVNIYDVPWQSVWSGTPPKDTARLEASLRALLESRYAAIVPPEAEGLDLSFTLVRDVDYGNGIVRFASSKHADLVVVGMTGRTILGYFVLGTTAEKAMRDSSCAVLAVK